MASATRVEEFTGQCPHCQCRFEGLDLPVTVVQQAYTAPALALLRGCGHLVVLTGRKWLVRCAEDARDALRPAPTVQPVRAADQRQEALKLPAHTDEVVGKPRGRR